MSALLEHGGFPEPFLARSARTLRRWQKERLDRFFREDVRDLEAKGVELPLGEAIEHEGIIRVGTVRYDNFHLGGTARRASVRRCLRLQVLHDR